MTDDTLGNVTGRAWLVAELDRIAEEVCGELRRVYIETRRGRTADRRTFVDSVDSLQAEAFLTARSVEDGGCDIRHVLSVFNWMARLDHAVHAPDVVKGRNKTAKECAAGFGSKQDAHERWAAAFDAAYSELSAAGRKRAGDEAARLAMQALGLQMTLNGFRRGVREYKARQK